MRLIVNNKYISFKNDVNVSIEKNSPALNDETGSFSYPFPVPRRPNEFLLNYPGKLTRTEDLPSQDFILEEGGLQLLAGEVDYDVITDDEIGLILKSGYSEFRGKMAGRKMSEVDFGYEPGIPDTTDLADLQWKISDSWDDANRVDNGKYVVTPCMVIGDQQGAVAVSVNDLDYATGRLKLSNLFKGSSNLFMLQFYTYYLLEKIYESAGYAILEDQLKLSDFKNYPVYTNPFRIRKALGQNSYWIDGMKTDENLYYSKLMPDITVLDFVDRILEMYCLMAIIDGINKTVRIQFKKGVVDHANINPMVIKELNGWEHQEEKNNGGFTIGYAQQDSDLDTKSDYEIEQVIGGLFPTPTEEGQVIRQTQEGLNVDKITVADGETLTWERIGRLRDYSEGNASEKIEINVKVPIDIENSWYPQIEIKTNAKTGAFEKLEDIYMSIYRGMVNNNGVNCPLMRSDPTWWDLRSLAPEYLFENCHKDFYRWKAFNAKGFTKYVFLSLPEVIALNFGNTYVINGVRVLMDKVSYDLPFRGIVKVEGWTV